MFKLVDSLNDASNSNCLSPPSSIDNLNDMFCNLMNDTVNEIKNAVNPIFCRPYLLVKLQNCINAVGLYDTGADISCVNASVFEKIPQTLRPMALPVSAKSNSELPGVNSYKLKANSTLM